MKLHEIVKSAEQTVYPKFFGVDFDPQIFSELVNVYYKLKLAKGSVPKSARRLAALHTSLGATDKFDESDPIHAIAKTLKNKFSSDGVKKILAKVIVEMNKETVLGTDEFTFKTKWDLVTAIENQKRNYENWWKSDKSQYIKSAKELVDKWEKFLNEGELMESKTFMVSRSEFDQHMRMFVDQVHDMVRIGFSEPTIKETIQRAVNIFGKSEFLPEVKARLYGNTALTEEDFMEIEQTELIVED
jgi:hypothetical protein